MVESKYKAESTGFCMGSDLRYQLQYLQTGNAGRNEICSLYLGFCSSQVSITFLFFFSICVLFFFFNQLEANYFTILQWFLSYIDMNQPWIYMYSPSRSPLPHPLHPIPLGLPRAPGPSTCLMHPTWAGDLFHYR